jgi:radical SAM-linked protein
VQRIRLRYAKRGRMRFTSHRDFARAFERALSRAAVPIAYSQGFTPHPKVSYASAAPTGVASEAEYLEIGLRTRVGPSGLSALAGALDEALPPGLDILAAVEAGAGSLAGRIEASRWRIELPGVGGQVVQAAVGGFLAASEVLVQRQTKHGSRTFDARDPVVGLELLGDRVCGPSEAEGPSCAILELVVRQVTPAVRPDDVLSGLHAVAGLEPPVAPRVTRLAQGVLTVDGEVVDLLVTDRDGSGVGASSH